MQSHGPDYILDQMTDLTNVENGRNHGKIYYAIDKEHMLQAWNPLLSNLYRAARTVPFSFHVHVVTTEK